MVCIFGLNRVTCFHVSHRSLKDGIPYLFYALSTLLQQTEVKGHRPALAALGSLELSLGESALCEAPLWPLEITRRPGLQLCMTLVRTRWSALAGSISCKQQSKRKILNGLIRRTVSYLPHLLPVQINTMTEGCACLPGIRRRFVHIYVKVTAQVLGGGEEPESCYKSR